MELSSLFNFVDDGFKCAYVMVILSYTIRITMACVVWMAWVVWMVRSEKGSAKQITVSASQVSCCAAWSRGFRSEHVELLALSSC